MPLILVLPDESLEKGRKVRANIIENRIRGDVGRIDNSGLQRNKVVSKGIKEEIRVYLVSGFGILIEDDGIF